MILLKKKFLDLVRRGLKRQTIRVWPKRRLRVGQAEFIPGLGRVRITAFERVRPADLTDEDARLDGFASKEALLAELRSLYGERLDQVPCFRIRFAYPIEEAAPDSARRRAGEPGEGEGAPRPPAAVAPSGATAPPDAGDRAGGRERPGSAGSEPGDCPDGPGA